MTYENFEDTPVWQEAARLYELAEALLENVAFHAGSGFRDQLDRAALSVSNNIAEGFERGTTNELLYFQKELLRKLPPGHPPRKDAEERGLI